MKAAVIEGGRALRVADVPMPVPAPGELLVRVEGCGVCASSLPVWQGRPWFSYPLDAGAPGHEGWGYVDGQRVAFLSSRAYAEYDVARADAVVPIPDALAGRRFPGEAIGCAMNIFRRSAIDEGQTVVIIGAGFLGNLLIQLAKSEGARVVAVSRRASARELARRCGADQTFAIDEPLPLKAERVIECVGTQEALDVASNAIGERGRLVIAGYHQDGLRQVNLQQWNWLGIDVVNAHERDPRNYVQGMTEAIDAVLAGRIDPEPLLTHDYPLDRLGQALDDVAARPDSFVKGTVIFR
ncbi:MAG TPA: zinc-binding dehydrogenase [Thermoanaerobaculia bacterium]|nr:zinc-binding dehydrogenase [Thermoanaerobaculia bacterium]